MALIQNAELIVTTCKVHSGKANGRRTYKTTGDPAFHTFSDIRPTGVDAYARGDRGSEPGDGGSARVLLADRQETHRDACASPEVTEKLAHWGSLPLADAINGNAAKASPLRPTPEHGFVLRCQHPGAEKQNEPARLS